MQIHIVDTVSFRAEQHHGTEVGVHRRIITQNTANTEIVHTLFQSFDNHLALSGNSAQAQTVVPVIVTDTAISQLVVVAGSGPTDDSRVTPGLCRDI